MQCQIKSILFKKPPLSVVWSVGFSNRLHALSDACYGDIVEVKSSDTVIEPLVSFSLLLYKYLLIVIFGRSITRYCFGWLYASWCVAPFFV